MHLWVDPLYDGHQIVKNVFCVVHGRIHEVPEKEDKKRECIFTVHNRPLLKEEKEGGREGKDISYSDTCTHKKERKTEKIGSRVKKLLQINFYIYGKYLR